MILRPGRSFFGVPCDGCTRGGGLEVVGKPSASKNLRTRSSSLSAGARTIGAFLAGGADRFFACVFFRASAARIINCTRPTIAIMTMRKMFSIGAERA